MQTIVFDLEDFRAKIQWITNFQEHNLLFTAKMFFKFLDVEQLEREPKKIFENSRTGYAWVLFVLYLQRNINRLGLVYPTKSVCELCCKWMAWKITIFRGSTLSGRQYWSMLYEFSEPWQREKWPYGLMNVVVPCLWMRNAAKNSS